MFLFSSAVGVFLGIFYDVFRIWRIAFNSKWASIFIQDFLFCVFSSLIIVILIFHTNSGSVRWFSLFGSFIAFLLYHLTVGKLVMYLAAKIIILVKKVLGFICKLIMTPIRFIIKLIKRTCLFIFGILSRFVLWTASRIRYCVILKKHTVDARHGYHLARALPIKKHKKGTGKYESE